MRNTAGERIYSSVEHSHDIEGEGEFLGKDGSAIPDGAGDVLVSQISEPHGLRAKTDLRLLVTIATPI